jgi:hypothetical protein
MSRARTSPLADELHEAAAEGTRDAAELARGGRHLRVRVTRLKGGGRIEPAGTPLTGPDALLVAEMPDSPLDRARLDAIQLHGVLSMVDDPHEDLATLDAEVQGLLTKIALEWGAHKKGMSR